METGLDDDDIIEVNIDFDDLTFMERYVWRLRRSP